MTLRAAIYARVSVEDKDDKDSSTDTQIRVCRERAKAEGWTVVATFTDVGISGGVPPNLRPDGARLIAARDAREFDVLIISEPTRLYRSDMLAAELRRWAAEDVRVVFVGNEINMADDEWELSAGMHGIIGQHFRKMISKKTHAALVSRALRRSWTGGRPYGYDNGDDPEGNRRILIVNKQRAAIVAEIFDRYTRGASCTDIARDLNQRGVPSSAAEWKRSERRSDGKWIDSAVRAILLNPIYTGTVHWNKSRWRLSERTGKSIRTERKPSDWTRYTYQEPAYRIVSDEVWHAAQARIKSLSNPDTRMKSGGKAVYRLSGLLKCGVCGRNFVIDSGTHYACPSAKSGACTNKIRQRRDDAETYILGAIDRNLLDPKMVTMMAREIERDLNARIDALQKREADRPAELVALDARLSRLRARLRDGDPDMAPDEIQAAIEKAEAKRADLLAARPEAKAASRVLSMLPKAAAAYRAMIAGGLSKHPEPAARARAAVRQLVGGEIRLNPAKAPDGTEYLEATFGLSRVALFSRVSAAYRFSGSGGRI
ncbi:MAG: recombinase family protein [Proteobacteria bacterium]|nr:recombinase family protein [Pseudomonadota bacterium]